MPAVVVALAVALVGAAPGQARADVPEVVVDHGGGSYAVMPGSGTAVVKVSLSAPPPTTTTVTIARDASNPVFVSSRHALTFSPTDWHVPQPVRLISLQGFGSGEFTVTGPGVAAGVIRAYSSTMPLPPNVNQACRVTFGAQGWNGGFAITATMTNTGPTPLTDWTLTALFGGSEKVTSAGTADWGQYGRGAAFSAPSWRRGLLPGESVSLGFVGTTTQSTITLPSLRCVPEPYLLPTPTPTPTTTPSPTGQVSRT